MSRIYVCDRCKKQFGDWSTTSVEISAQSFFGKKLNAELCGTCLEHFRRIFNIFMDGNNFFKGATNDAETTRQTSR